MLRKAVRKVKTSHVSKEKQHSLRLWSGLAGNKLMEKEKTTARYSIKVGILKGYRISLSYSWPEGKKSRKELTTRIFEAQIGAFLLMDVKKIIMLMRACLPGR